MSEPIYIGVDLGGTTIKSGICNANGTLLHMKESPTDSQAGPDAVLERIVQDTLDLVRQSAFQWEQVVGVGAGIAAFMDVDEGLVKLAPNLGWRDVPVKQRLEEKLGKPVAIDNDANVATLGEAWSGAGAGIENCVCYTLGTGVGGGLILNGRIYRGYNGLAGEIGHMVVAPDLEAVGCGCGKKGCLETIASATGLVNMARAFVERGDHTSLALLPNMTAKDVCDAARSGDEVALRIVNRAAMYLGKSMATLSVVLNPQRFIIGGGVSKAGDILLDAVKKAYASYAQEASSEGVEIVQALLGNNAGMIGAASLTYK